MNKRKIFSVMVTQDNCDRFFDIGLHSCSETWLSFNIGFFGCVVWISLFDTFNP